MQRRMAGYIRESGDGGDNSAGMSEDVGNAGDARRTRGWRATNMHDRRIAKVVAGSRRG